MRRGRRRRRIRGGKNVIITRAKNKLRRLVGMMWATRTLKKFIHFSGGFVRCMTLDGDGLDGKERKADRGEVM